MQGNSEQPKSYQFRRERESLWRELEGLVQEADKRGLRRLSADRLARLPVLYRQALSSLSVARAISLDRNLVLYLDALCARSYFHVYGARGNFFSEVAGFFTRGFPAAVQAGWGCVALSALLLFAGTLAGYVLTMGNTDWFYSFVSAELAGSRGPSSSAEDLRQILFPAAADRDETLKIFASYLFTHNTKVGMLAFALGFALGIPTALLLFSNGLMLGAFLALHDSKGLLVEFTGWVLIHGVTELLAIILCGGAGLMLGRTMIAPGSFRRLDALAQQGRVAGRIVLGSVFLFMIAGLLEGFARQLVTDTEVRLLIAGTSLLLLAAYFLPRRRQGGRL